ncbi:MAG: 6-carboxytetrahydropterin synthase, partial [Pseudomonadota bacterium]
HAHIDVAFMRETLSEDEIVVDIGRAHDALKAILAPINYANLDELPAFAGKKTTTEFLCRHIFDAMAVAIRAGDLGPGADGITRMRVMLNESHVARAWYEGAV